MLSSHRFTGRPVTGKACGCSPSRSSAASSWLASLWAHRDTLRKHHMTLLWGMRDIAFRPNILEIWERTFPHARIIRLENVGHFPALEATDRLVAAVRFQTSAR